MTDLSFMYQCGKCSKNFATPDQLKNHEIPCRGKHPAEDLDSMLSSRMTKDLTYYSPKRGLPTSDWIPERVSDE
jgi:hypothetical protein